jgi:hypothetical protein
MLEHENYADWLKRNLPKRKNPENIIKNACRQWLTAHGIINNRQQSGRIKAIHPKTRKEYWVYLADEGSGDIVGCTKKGRFYEVETKAPNGNWSDEQRTRKKIIEASGGIYILAFSVDDLTPLLNA